MMKQSQKFERIDPHHQSALLLLLLLHDLKS